MSLLVTDNTDCEREQDKWTNAKRGFVGVSANFAVTAALPLNAASIRFQPLHPTSLALMPPPAAPAVDRRETSHVDERGDHDAEGLEKRTVEQQGLAGVDLAGTDLAGTGLAGTDLAVERIWLERMWPGWI